MSEIAWNLEPPSDFQGLRGDIPITFYHRHLPHWRQNGATYFVTFRQADSLPQSKLRELKAIRAEWERKHAQPWTDEQWQQYSRETTGRVEHWLDQGMGSCLLREVRAANCVIESMHHFDNSRYDLGCYVVMPNHVHVIVRPLCPDVQPLERILHSWKRHSSRKINELIGLTGGSFWQEESFDRIIRDEAHLYRCIQYIGRNPRNAKLPLQGIPMWIRPEWERIGWRFDM